MTNDERAARETLSPAQKKVFDALMTLPVPSRTGVILAATQPRAVVKAVDVGTVFGAFGRLLGGG